MTNLPIKKVLDKLPEEVTIIGAVFGLDGQQVYDSLIELGYLIEKDDGSIADTEYAYVSEVNGWIAEEVLEHFRQVGVKPPSGYYVNQLTNELIDNLKNKAIKRYTPHRMYCM